MAQLIRKVTILVLATGLLAACETIGEATSSTSQKVGSWFQSAKGAITGDETDANAEQSYFARQVGGSLANADAEAMDREGAKALDQGTAGKAIEWRNPDTGVQVVFVPGDPVLEKRNVSATLKPGVSEPRDLEIIGSTYQSQHNANLRSSPGIENKVVGRLDPGEQFTAVGRSHGRGWILVAKGHELVGYVYEPLVVPTSSVNVKPELREAKAALSDEKSAPSGNRTILAVTSCRNLAYDVTTGDGQRSRAEIRACKASDGAWEIN